VKSLTSYFLQPKGEDDVRLVYDATRSGLNKQLWAPSFHLPTSTTLCRTMCDKSWIGDMDLADMFLNFPLDNTLQPYYGIDLSPYIPTVTTWERWTRCMMGLKPSPYCTIKGLLLAFELIQGDRRDSQNIFHWSDIVLNLPGKVDYDSTQLRLWKYNPCTQGMAAACLSYVDDLRPVGLSSDVCWGVMHCIATGLSCLGIQVATRKTQPPTTRPGPWAGTVGWATEREVCIRSTQEKWRKAQKYVKILMEELADYQANPLSKGLDFKCLESIRGFMVHLQGTYPALTPYLKGLHFTLYAWGGGGVRRMKNPPMHCS